MVGLQYVDERQDFDMEEIVCCLSFVRVDGTDCVL